MHVSSLAVVASLTYFVAAQASFNAALKAATDTYANYYVSPADQAPKLAERLPQTIGTDVVDCKANIPTVGFIHCVSKSNKWSRKDWFTKVSVSCLLDKSNDCEINLVSKPTGKPDLVHGSTFEQSSKGHYAPQRRFFFSEAEFGLITKELNKKYDANCHVEKHKQRLFVVCNAPNKVVPQTFHASCTLSTRFIAKSLPTGCVIS